MDREFKPPKKVLVLMSHPKAFDAMEAVLKEIGSTVTDDVDATTDVAIMDSFYWNSEAAQVIKNRNEAALTLLVLREDPVSRQVFDGIDDTLVAAAGQTQEDLFFSLTGCFKRHFGLTHAELLSRQFGDGLWISMLSRLSALKAESVLV